MFLLREPAVHQDYVGLTPVLAGNAGEQVGRRRGVYGSVGDVTLAGTLTRLMAMGRSRHPAHPGSGPQDRDGNTPPEFATDMFKLMAEYFGPGCAVSCYDERGRESTGDYNVPTAGPGG